MNLCSTSTTMPPCHWAQLSEQLNLTGSANASNEGRGWKQYISICHTTIHSSTTNGNVSNNCNDTGFMIRAKVNRLALRFNVHSVNELCIASVGGKTEMIDQDLWCTETNWGTEPRAHQSFLLKLCELDQSTYPCRSSRRPRQSRAAGVGGNGLSQSAPSSGGLTRLHCGNI